MRQVPQTSDDAPVVCYIDFVPDAVFAQLQSLLNRRAERVAVLQHSLLQQTLGVCCLTERDPVGLLMYFNAKVETKLPQITHAE